MSLKERLEALKKQRLEERSMVEARKREGERRKEKEEKKRVAEFERLEKIAKEKLFPVFEIVNEVHLDGKGMVSLERVGLEPLYITVNLDWGGYSHDDRGFQSWGGERLEINLERNLDVRLKGAAEQTRRKAPETIFNLNDGDWEQRLEDGICLILSKPLACHWGGSKCDLSR